MIRLMIEQLYKQNLTNAIASSTIQVVAIQVIARGSSLSIG